MDNFINPDWQARLTQAGLTDFEAFWTRPCQWFEEPNVRRGGWSGVGRLELTTADGCPGLFMKRQQNHQTRTWRHPVRGVPTFEVEFSLIQRYRECGIPSLEPVFFAAREQGSDVQAVLVTRELEGFRSMFDTVEDWFRDGVPDQRTRRLYLAAIAQVLRRIHDQKLVHNCFFPAHIFVRKSAGSEVEVRIIDLEKSRYRPFRILCTIRDLFSLIRRSHVWSLTDRLYFFRTYTGESSLSTRSKALWRFLVWRAKSKGRLNKSSRSLRCGQP